MDKNNILPADTYIVVNKSIMNNEDRKILNMLYQPIIGPLPIILYFTLWADLDKMEFMSGECSHQHLATNMHLTLEEIISIREKLEAVGLLRTRVKKGNINNYIYELYSPLSVHEIFNHPILNVVLYNNVGKKEYDKLVEYFKIPKLNTSGYEEITASFSEVFSSVPLTSYDVINDDIRKCNKLKLNINTNFDFNFLIASMPKSVDVDRCFTKDIKELILNLSFLYEIDAMHMQNIIKGCINERGTISKEELRKSCRNYYQFDHGGILPSIVANTQPEYLRNPVGDTSKRARMIYSFETISPYDILKKKNNGAEPLKRDLKLAEDLIVEHGLKPGVVNVLLDYTLKTNNNKLNRNFVETIAGQWKRLHVETAKDAMEVAEKEHKKYTTKLQKETNKKITNETPVWFDANIKKEQLSEKETQELETMLNKYND